MTEQIRQTRLIILAVVLMCALGGLSYRLIYLHLLTDEQVKQSVEEKGTVTKSLITGRGRIIDGSKGGNILALNVGVRDICADPSLIVASNKVQSIARQLASMLSVDPDDMTQRLNRPDRRFAFLARNIPEEKARLIMASKIPGIFTRETTMRCYPQGRFMCHVLGFSNLEGVGAAGVEQIMDRFLKGSPGLIESKLDGRRREMYGRRIRDIPAQEGADVYLTIDQNIQYMVETALDRSLAQNHARAAWAIVERVRTGEILAMVNRPAFDLNTFPTAANDEKLNRAIGSVFEPGSTFKVAVIAAALNEGLVTSNTVFNVENGRWLYRGKILRDYHSYHELTVSDIIKKSSNIGAAKVALMLGDERFARYLHDFNIGRRLGIDLPGEEAGILAPVTRWSGISASRIAIGQGVAVTALQMLGVVCAIANEGFLMKPHLIKRVVAKDGTVLYTASSEVLSRPIRGDTAALMREIMTRVTEPGGTGTKAAIEGYRIAGKTGSAQKPVGGHYSETDYMATFVGFLPAESPELAMIVTYDEPQPFHTGGIVAAPVFGEIAEQVVRYLDIAPPMYHVAER